MSTGLKPEHDHLVEGEEPGSTVAPDVAEKSSTASQTRPGGVFYSDVVPAGRSNGDTDEGEAENDIDGSGIKTVRMPQPSFIPSLGLNHVTETDLDLRDPRVLKHELNNPLTIISTAASGIARFLRTRDSQAETSESHAKIQDLVGIIHESVAQISGIVNHIAALESTFPDPTDVEATPHLKKINVSDVVKAQVHSWKTLVESEGVKITHELEDDVYIRGDSVSLYEILSNVLKNAIEIAKKHSGTPEIHVVLRSDSSGLVQIIIQDNGPGINPNDFGRIFTRGFTKKNGHGIGLWRSKKLVKEMGGYLDLVNNRDRHDLDAGENITGASAVIELQRYLD